MKAMVLPRFGGPDLFELREIDRPEPGPGEVLVRVMASGTNPVDAKLRANGSWAHLEPPVVLGYDAAGVVEKVGPGVTEFSGGEEVYYTPEIFGNPLGTYATYNVAPANLIARKPANLSFEESAAIPLAGGTAWEAIVRRLQVGLGETVLIQGGAGGVGSFAVQFAKAAGAKVFATASAEHQETLKQLGADVAIDYAHQDPIEIVMRETDQQGVDAVFDIQGPDLVSRSLPALRPFGRIACILPPQGDLSALYQDNIALYGVYLTRERERLEEMTPVFERGLARPLIDQVLPLEEVSEAHRRLDSGHGRGKVVLHVG
jgi:NADPH:quinone reductase